MTNLRTLKNSELVAMYNAAAEKLGMKPVNKFADKETAIVRTKALMAKIGTEVVDAAVRESTLPPPAAGVLCVVPALVSESTLSPAAVTNTFWLRTVKVIVAEAVVYVEASCGVSVAVNV